MTRLDDVQLDSICGGGAATQATKAVVGHALPILDAGTSLYDGYSAYSQARADNKGVAQSLGEGTIGAIRSFTLYDLWSPVFLPTPAY